jgi:PhnB protein
MSNQSTPAVPPQPIIPHLVVQNGLEAVAFYERALGARSDVMVKPDGRLMHGALQLPNGGWFYLMEPPTGQSAGGSNVVIHLEVPDADATWQKAMAAGVTPIMPLADQFWGARYGIFSDPFGHTWSVATQKHKPSVEEMERAARAALSGGH